MKKVVIIGGAGFVGSHLVDLCISYDIQVLVYDNFSTGRRAFLPDNHLIKIVDGDILDSQNLETAINNFSPDVLYHLAAIHHIPTCEKTPDKALRVNVEGTQSVLTACGKSDIPRIVFASTGALYDPANSGALLEDSPVKTHNIYSISKQTGEQLLAYHADQFGAQTVIARLFNVVGRRETNQHVIPAIMTQLSSGNREIALGNLHPRRDYIHVEDVADALFAISSILMTVPCDVFNIGSGREYSVGELVELCAEIIAEPVEIVSDPVRRRKSDRPSQLADVTKLQEASNWRPKRTLKQALAEIWQETLSSSNGV
jgi:UDP-glucose 4-epimerase